ncbi:MAG: right-handed parallel beta-helix repeat-containing protein [Sandaracinobacteroides sp.]
MSRTLGIGTLVPLFLAGCSGAGAGTIPVKTDAELAAAIATARAGDRIELAPGSYGPVQIRNRKIPQGTVTLAGKGAGISHVEIVGSKGWALDGLEIGGSYGTRNRTVYVENSSDLSITNNYIHGINVNNDPWDDMGVGVGLRNARNVEIKGNRLRDLANTIIVGSSANVRVEGNSIAYVREGINWVAVDGGAIRCNRFSHFYPNWIRKEHPDAIQAWGNKNGNSNNLLIEGNVLNLGGPRAIQGIFMAGVYRPDDDVRPARLRNITIRDNIYYGSSLHGISLYVVENAVIERNTVLPSPHAQQADPPPRSADGRRSSALMPRIRVVGDTSTGMVADNIAVTFTLPPAIEARNNQTVSGRVDGSSPWKKLFASPPRGHDPALDNFLVDPKSEAGRNGRGARQVCGALLPAAVDAPAEPDPSGYPAL